MDNEKKTVWVLSSNETIDCCDNNSIIGVYCSEDNARKIFEVYKNSERIRNLKDRWEKSTYDSECFSDEDDFYEIWGDSFCCNHVTIWYERHELE